MVSKWIANLDSTIILWKSIFLLKNLYGCIFALSRQIKRKKHFILGFHKNIKSLVPIFMKNCMSQSLTRKQRVRKICIWICPKWQSFRKICSTVTPVRYCESVLWSAQLTKQESGVAYKCYSYFLFKDF